MRFKNLSVTILTISLLFNPLSISLADVAEKKESLSKKDEKTKVTVAESRRRELESVILIDEVSEAMLLCNQKLALDQKVALLGYGKEAKDKRHYEVKHKEVKDTVLAEQSKKEVKEDIQFESHRLRALSASGNQTVVYKRKKSGFFTRNLFGFAKFLNKLKKKKQTRYMGKCIDALRSKSNKCGDVISESHSFLTGMDEKQFQKMSLNRQPDREKFIIESRRRVTGTIDNSCKKRDKKKIIKKCKKFFNELEENRVACKDFQEHLKKNRSVLQMFFDSTISVAHAGSVIDKEFVRKDIQNNVRGTAQKWATFTFGRDVMLENFDEWSEDRNTGYTQIEQDYQDQIDTSISQMNKLNNGSYKAGGFEFDFKENDYTLKNVEDIDKVLSGIKFTDDEKVELAIAIKELSKHTENQDDVGRFFRAFRKSVLTNKNYPNPKYEIALENTADSFSKALKSVRDPLDDPTLSENEQKYLALSKKKGLVTKKLYLSDLKKIDLSPLIDTKNDLSLERNYIASMSPVEEILKDESREDSNSLLKKDSDLSLSKSSTIDISLQKGKITTEHIVHNPHGFHLSNNPETDKELQLKLYMEYLKKKESSESITDLDGPVEYDRSRDKHLFDDIIHPAYQERLGIFVPNNFVKKKK